MRHPSIFSAPVPCSSTFAATVSGDPGTNSGSPFGHRKKPSESRLMRTVPMEPVSPVAIPAKDAVSRRESFSAQLCVDLPVNLFSVLCSSAVDVVDGEEITLTLSAAGALPAVGGDNGFSQPLVVKP